jgi:hypothetical protein
MKTTLRICGCLLPLATILFFATMLSAGEIQVIPVTDACAVRPYQQMFNPVGDRYQPSTGPGNAAQPERCTMQFSLSLIPGGQKIDSATFVLSCAGGRNDDPEIVAYGYAGTGRIQAPNNFTDEANRIAGPANGECPFTTAQDITNFVSTVYRGGGTHVGITLAITGKDAMRAYYSRDYGSNQPMLVVRYSPANDEEE